ncbi:MAG: hypothetical protein ACXVAX_13160 [Pseudobdellovibrio sp.]
MKNLFLFSVMALVSTSVFAKSGIYRALPASTHCSPYVLMSLDTRNEFSIQPLEQLKDASGVTRLIPASEVYPGMINSSQPDWATFKAENSGSIELPKNSDSKVTPVIGSDDDGAFIYADLYKSYRSYLTCDADNSPRSENYELRRWVIDQDFSQFKVQYASKTFNIDTFTCDANYPPSQTTDIPNFLKSGVRSLIGALQTECTYVAEQSPE